MGDTGGAAAGLDGSAAAPTTAHHAVQRPRQQRPRAFAEPGLQQAARGQRELAQLPEIHAIVVVVAAQTLFNGVALGEVVVLRQEVQAVVSAGSPVAPGVGVIGSAMLVGDGRTNFMNLPLNEPTVRFSVVTLVGDGMMLACLLACFLIFSLL